MDNNKQFVNLVKKEKLIAIIRGVPLESMEPLFEALQAGGIRLVEVTMNTAGALACIREMNKQFGQELVIGAGTVLGEAMARQAAEAGSRFLLSPNLDEEMVRTSIELGLPPIPGVLTPTEIMNAVRLGAPIVKLFPVSSLGARYIREICAPLNHIDMIAVGGIDESNASELLDAGVIGLGVGSSLIDKKRIAAGDFEAIKEKAKRLVAVVQRG